MVNIDFLHPQVKAIYLKFCEICKEQNLKFELTSTYNTRNEQNILYRQGRFGDGTICTNHRYPNSYHNWGLAFDIQADDGNKLNILANNLMALGMKWGFYDHDACVNDKYHFYLPLLKINDLKSKYKSYDEYRDTWNADYKKPSMVTPHILESASRNKQIITRLQHACVLDNISSRNRQGVMVTGTLDAVTIAAIANIKNKFNENRYYSILQFIQSLLVQYDYDININGTYNSELIFAITDFKTIYELNMDKLITDEFILFLMAKLH